MIDIPCITLILSKIGKSLLNFPLLIFVIRPDSQCDSLGVFYGHIPNVKALCFTSAKPSSYIMALYLMNIYLLTI